MAFPFHQPPPHHAPMYPESFNHGGGRLDRRPANIMPPAKKGSSAPSGNIVQKMLGRFFPTGGAQQTAALPPQATNGPTAGGGLTNTLNNVQQVLNVVQQTAPIVKEYGPMVKNIPAMLRMVKAFNNLNADDPEASTKDNNDQQTEKQTTTQKTSEKSITNKSADTQTSGQLTAKSTIPNGESKPILFI